MKRNQPGFQFILDKYIRVAKTNSLDSMSNIKFQMKNENFLAKKYIQKFHKVRR